ncbi:hypothetical protein RSAG8_03311, partial [Rhizoctonia solani AG-8 WAC10335]
MRRTLNRINTQAHDLIDRNVYPRTHRLADGFLSLPQTSPVQPPITAQYIGDEISPADRAPCHFGLGPGACELVCGCLLPDSGSALGTYINICLWRFVTGSSSGGTGCYECHE